MENSLRHFKTTFFFCKRSRELQQKKVGNMKPKYEFITADIEHEMVVEAGKQVCIIPR